jgi:ACS family hexuronate transporter-like MFS transporter
MNAEGRFKWLVCGLLFLAVTILYMDRQALSILAPRLSQDLGWTETDYGNMVAAYQFAYAAGVFAAGWLIDRLGTRAGFVLFMALWSVATAAHGWAASVTAFIAARFALGLTQAGCFPCAIKATAEWFPKEERALATGLFNTGSMVGPILAPLAILALYAGGGWLVTCAALGAVGLAWGGAWLALYRTPGTPNVQYPMSTVQRPTSENEGEPLPVDPLRARMSRPRDGTDGDVGGPSILRSRAAWAFFFGKLLSDPVWWFFLFWLPKFLHDRHGVALTQLGAPLVVVYTITIAGSVGAGWLTKRLTRGGFTVRAARRTVMFLCALLPVPVLLAADTPHVWLAVLVIGLATAGHSGWMANLFSLVSDHFPKSRVAAVTGMGTMAGALGGIFIARFAGWLLDATGSYKPLFFLAAGAYLLAWLLVNLLLPRKTNALTN